MSDSLLLITVDHRGVARLTMNRPERRNAFDEALLHGFCDAIGRLGADSAVRAIVITGAGSSFCSGADVNMMARASTRSASENKDDARRLSHLMQSVHQSPKPTIALVNGAAIAAGIGLIAACDIAIASETAFFAFSEVRTGLIPAVISPFVIEAIGARAARRYFLTGEQFDARVAQEMGLIHAIAPAGGLDEASDLIVRALLQGGPEAQTAAKQLISDIAGQPITDQLFVRTADRIAERRQSAEGREGVAAFLEKRRPDWGRHE